MGSNTLLLISSILITTAIGILGFWFDREKITTKWKRVLFMAAMTLLILSGGWLTYRMTKDSEAENAKLQQAEKESQQILKKAHEQIMQQSKVINDGFNRLNTSFAAIGISDQRVEASLEKLRTQVAGLATYSQQSISEALNAGNTSAAGPAGTFTSKIGEVMQIDSKTTMTVVEKLEGSPDAIKLIVNGSYVKLNVGDRRHFYNENRESHYIVYKGESNGKFNFYVHKK